MSVKLADNIWVLALKIPSRCYEKCVNCFAESSGISLVDIFTVEKYHTCSFHDLLPPFSAAMITTGSIYSEANIDWSLKCHTIMKLDSYLRTRKKFRTFRKHGFLNFSSVLQFRSVSWRTSRIHCLGFTSFIYDKDSTRARQTEQALYFILVRDVHNICSADCGLRGQLYYLIYVFF